MRLMHVSAFSALLHPPLGPEAGSWSEAAAFLGQSPANRRCVTSSITPLGFHSFISEMGQLLTKRPSQRNTENKGV